MLDVERLFVNIPLSRQQDKKNGIDKTMKRGRSGSVSTMSRSQWAKRIAYLLILVAISFVSLRLAARRFYYSDREKVETYFRAIPRARILGIDGFDDSPVWTGVTVRLTIPAKDKKRGDKKRG